MRERGGESNVYIQWNEGEINVNKRKLSMSIQRERTYKNVNSIKE